MVGVWTIEVGGSARNYKKASLERKLDTKIPSKFTAIVEYSAGIAYWDLVEIKRDGTTEWKGFVEDKEDFWDKDGHFLSIGGRDTTLILWKKWSEGFVDMHEATEGFFGSVSAVELIKFLLRCPKSDPVGEFPYNKEGWGIDKSKISSCRATRTSVGDPNWVKLRKRGYGWRNSGSPYNSVNADVDAVISNAWSTFGVSPYINATDGTSYIYSKTANQEGIFSFENLSTLAPTATNVEKCFLNIVWRPEASWWYADRARVKAYISGDNGVTWSFAGYFDGKGSIFGPIVWQTFSFDVSSVIDTVTKADSARVKFICQENAQLYAYIDHAYLTFSYITGGSQSYVNDEFDVILSGAETLVGLYMESRMDNDSYPRNYGVLSITDNKQVYTGYTETDPNIHISKTASHIDFDAYMNEDAYVYKDFGAGYFDTYFDHIFEVQVVTDPVTGGARLGIWAVANDIDDYVGLATGVRNNLAMAIQDGGGSQPYFTLREVNGGASTIDSGVELTEGTVYTIWIKRRSGNVKAYIYTGGIDGTLFDTLEVNMAGASNTFRYLYGCLTANTGDATHTDVNIDNLLIMTYIDLGYVNDNTFRDVIHSWTPQPITHLRIRITIDDASHSWAISQLYLYKAESLNYRVWNETGSPSFPDEQYIQAFSYEPYTTPIGPLNIPKARLLDAIADIVNMANESYIPYEFWLALDAENTFNIVPQRGSDISGSVSFVKGTNLGAVKKDGSVADTVQRVQVIGKAEGKRQEKVSSDWTEDTAEMNNVNSFYEDVSTEKTISSKEVADLLANIELNEVAPPKEPKTVHVTRDTYASMAYDVGDTATFTDSLTSLSGSHRIYNIQKTIDNNGEDIVLTIDSKRRIPEEEIKNIYRRLKELGLVGVLTADWVGEADKENKVDAKVVTESFSRTAKNGEESDKDITDPSWYISEVPASYSPYGDHVAGTSVQYYTLSNGKMWKHKSEWMGLWGPNTGSGADAFYVERRGESYIDELDVRMDQNPKFEAEIRAIRDTTGNINGGSACNWKVGDFVELGMYDAANSYGFFFRLIKEAAGNVLKVYACWNVNATDEYTELIREIDISDHENDDIRYKLEILTEKQDDNQKYVIFNVYDLNVEGQKYPPSSIVANVENNMVIKPFYAKISADRNNDAANLCILYIYSYKVEWEKLNPYYLESYTES